MARLEKEKGVNVQVLLRCRPLNEDELLSNAPQVVTCHDSKREVSVSQNIAGKPHERTFTFDRVFGPQSQQKDLYDQSIVPIVNEVLEGFNCTIFAYGQTGTGKTYTMEGSGRRTGNEELPPDAGVIPRAIKQIFDTLELQNAEYSVKVTFLELYNEETTDLLVPEEVCRVPDDKKRHLTLMEDGKGGVIVRGLEEVIVTNSTEIFNLLDRGSAKRRTAETLLNKQSSRSHSIFSITIHIKESTPDGEELMKCGKLNLVDLAGSENICRSGAREGRAREAGEINKSLLTLGRVITSLVEHLGHVPYRDSKLTRLLRDSLGGRTRTCIIATVSPSVHCLEETMSTLDYAQRAKSIKNKPEVNQKLMKATLIKELYGEIERLKTELIAAREKNGVYIPKERFYQDEADKKAMAMKIDRVEDELETSRKLLDEMQARYESEHERCNDISARLRETQSVLENTMQALAEAKEATKLAEEKIKESEFIISNQRQCESALLEKTENVRSSFEQTARDVVGLFTKLDRKKQIETSNKKTLKDFQSQLAKCLSLLGKEFSLSAREQQEKLMCMDKQIRTFMSSKTYYAEELKSKLEDMKLVYSARLQGLHESITSHESMANLVLDKFNCTSSDHFIALQDMVRVAVLEADTYSQDLESTLTKQQHEIAAFAHHQREGVQKHLMATKEIFRVTFDAFDQLGREFAELFHCIEEGDLVQEHSLSEFEKNFEEQARQEEQQMLEDIAAMLTKSKARRSALVRATVSGLREQAISEREILTSGLKNVTSLASEIQSGWESFMSNCEVTSAEELRQLGASHCGLEALAQKSLKSTHGNWSLWEKIQASVNQHAKDHIPAIDSLVRESKAINTRLESSSRDEIFATQETVETSNASVYDCIYDEIKQDIESMHALQFSVSNQLQQLADFESSHNARVEEIKKVSSDCFSDIKEYQSTSLTPARKDILVPSRASIEEMRAPDTEVILKFREKKFNERLVNVGSENTSKPSQLNQVPVTRIPLARLN